MAILIMMITWVQVLALPSPGCVALNKILNPGKHPVYNCTMGITPPIWKDGFEAINEIK